MPPLARLRVTIVVLSLLLVVSPLFAASHDGRRPPQLAQRAVHAFSFAEAWMKISRLWQKEGSSLDPMGAPKPNPPASPGAASPVQGTPLAPQ
jgi:hypothetical protein